MPGIAGAPSHGSRHSVPTFLGHVSERGLAPYRLDGAGFRNTHTNKHGLFLVSGLVLG